MFDKYQRPLSEFINKYAGANRNPKSSKTRDLSRLFCDAVDAFTASLKGKPFRLTTSLNAAVYDSCMVGLAPRLAAEPKRKLDYTAICSAYDRLLKDKGYMEAVSRSTADVLFVQRRIDKATKAFSDC